MNKRAAGQALAFVVLFFGMAASLTIVTLGALALFAMMRNWWGVLAWVVAGVVLALLAWGVWAAVYHDELEATPPRPDQDDRWWLE